MQVIIYLEQKMQQRKPFRRKFWVEAAERADSLGVDVINTSLGYTTFDNPNYSYTPADMDGNTAYITKGANIAFEKGILVVNSAGNSGAKLGLLVLQQMLQVYLVLELLRQMVLMHRLVLEVVVHNQLKNQML